MRRALLILAVLAPAARASTLDVRVRTPAGTAIPGARVAALSFNNGNPDATSTRFAVTDSSGLANFSGSTALVDGRPYTVVADTQGFLPSVVDQFNQGAPGVHAAPSASTPSITVTLSAGSGVGTITVDVTGATPNSAVFTQVGLRGGGGAAAYGFAQTDGTGAVSPAVFNVAYASAGTYVVSTYDPVKNRSAAAEVNLDLNPGTTPVGPFALNLANAPPPATTVNRDQQSGAAGGLSVDGVVTDTDSVNAIPFLHLSFSAQYKDPYGQTQHDFRGANTDQNGRFQLYGLIHGVTYYTTVYSGCSGVACYQGVQSTAQAQGFNAAPGAYDFRYSSGTTLRPAIKLAAIPPSSGALAVYVTDEDGNPFPHAGVSLFSDWGQWQTDGDANCGTGPNKQDPGIASFNVQASTGYALIKGLVSGNYQLRAYTPYGEVSFNAGPDRSFQFGRCDTSISEDDDDLRLNVSTYATPSLSVFDVFGAAVSTPTVGASSVTLRVHVPTGTLTGLVKGTLTFPGVVDLSQSPILITLNPQCQPNQPCSGGGFKSFSSSATGPTVSYSIPVSSGGSYWMNVVSNYWGPVFAGGRQPQPNLSSTGTAVANISFFPSGRVLGYLRKPDGSVYIPPNSQSGGGISVNASANNSWGGAQLSADGSFAITGLLPGVYTMNVQNFGSGSFPYTIKQPAAQVSVSANQDTRQDAYLESAVRVRPLVAISSLPALAIHSGCSPNGGDGECPPQNWRVFALPQGTPLGASAVRPMLVGDKTEAVFDYSVAVGTSTRCRDGQQNLPQPGFCYGPMTAGAVNGAGYDFYVARWAGFDSEGLAGGARPHLVIQTSSRAVVVGPAFAKTPVYNPSQQSTTTVQDLILTPPADLSGTAQAVLAGTVTISNIITSQQFAQMGGDFNKFLEFLPLIWLYDSTGAIKAVGVTVPYPPAEKPFDAQLSQSVASGDYSLFRTLTGPAPSGWGAVGYEIRGLTAGRAYTMVVTSPNYPPYKTSVTLGAAGSTTTANVDFDANPGATLSGVVRSTAGAAIAGAQVSVKARGFETKTLTTDSAGAWSVAGLAPGVYQVLAIASGYVQQAKDATAAGSGSVSVPAFVLTASNASISGSVYTNNPICPPGSTGCAAFGRTSVQDATVLAYDDTLNATDPGAPLPLYRAVTDSSGTYVLTGLRAGSLYKVFVNASGYYVQNQSTLTVAGARTGFDFSLKPKPLDVNVYGRPASPNFRFQVTNFQQFSDGAAWIDASPFDKATSTDVSTLFSQQPDSLGKQQLLLEYPLSALTTGTVYVLHIEAQPNDPRAPKVVKDVSFGLNLPRNACQSIDEALLGDADSTNSQGLPSNRAPIDISGDGDGSGLSMPAGGLIPVLSTTVPSMCMSETSASAAPQAAAARTAGISLDAFLSGVYQITLSSINYTQKGVDLTLSYDQSTADLSDMAIFYFTGGSWRSVPGTQTIDPVRGTISVQGLKSLASVLGTGAAGAGGAEGRRFMAVSDGRGYSPNALSVSAVSDAGSFAVLRPSQVGAGAFTGTTVRVYNFPNPFNLQSKTVALNATGLCAGGAASSLATDGTVIKYEIPAGVSGQVAIRIYTLSGRLVRELDGGQAAASSCYYTTWDGRNRSGQAVANGVYYGLLSVGGSKPATFKLAVIK